MYGFPRLTIAGVALVVAFAFSGHETYAGEPGVRVALARAIGTSQQSSPANCIESVSFVEGKRVQKVKCTLGQTCEDGQRCCNIGATYWCCAQDKRCGDEENLCK